MTRSGQEVLDFQVGGQIKGDPRQNARWRCLRERFYCTPALPIRVQQRHVVNSIATVRTRIVKALISRLSHYPACHHHRAMARTEL